MLLHKPAPRAGNISGFFRVADKMFEGLQHLRGFFSMYKMRSVNQPIPSTALAVAIITIPALRASSTFIRAPAPVSSGKIV